MDLKQFNNQSPGKLIRNETGETCFLPDALPANFAFDNALWPLLADAKQQVALLEGIGRNLPNPALLLKPLEERESLQSSRLEGTYITAQQYFMFDLEADSDDRDRRHDWREVRNYRKALNHGQESELPLCLRLIKELHSKLMTGIPNSDITPGEFRTHQVAIGSNKRFIPPPTTSLVQCLNDFECYMNEGTVPDPLIHCYLCHYQFETIHPFHDGNGRVGRLLLALMFQRLCGLTKPWLYLSDILERQRDRYCESLFDVSAKGNWNGWLEMCLECTIEQAKNTIKRCEKLNHLRTEFGNRTNATGGTTRLNQIVDTLFSSPFITVTKIVEMCSVTYPTANSDCQRLTKCKILEEIPNTKVKTYYSPEIFEIAYEGIE